MKNWIFGMISLAVLSACDGKSKEGTLERATAEQEAARDVDNRNLKQKSEQLEADLSKMHRLYRGLEGEYQGTVSVNRSPAVMQTTITRTIPEYKGTRVRQLSEVETDINSLRLNVQTRQTHPKFPNSTVGCSYSLVRPDFNQGFLELQPASANAECHLVYRILLSDLSLPDSELRELHKTHPRWVDLRETARQQGARLQNGDIQSVNELVGTVQSTFSSEPFPFSVRRVRD